MKLKKLLIVVTLFIVTYHAVLIALGTDQEALVFCKSHTESFLAIVWPIAQGKDEKIEKLFRKYGTLQHKKVVYFNHTQGARILQDAHPHITNMQEHMKMYFPSSSTFAKPARVYLLTFKNLETAVKCKHAVRHLFDLGYSSIHITDYHHEAIKLAEFFYIDKGVRKACNDTADTTVDLLDFLRLFGAYIISKQS